MKLQELAAPQRTKQVAKVMESYFGGQIGFDQLTRSQARHMLGRVRSLITEHRREPEFHRSEQNPAYLKLVMMEQGLKTRLRETPTLQVGQASGGTATATGQSAGSTSTSSTPTVSANPQAAAAAKSAQMNMLTKIKDPKLQAAMKKSIAGQTLNPGEQQLVANAAMAGGGATMASEHRLRRNLYRTLRESEIQQAQVVLASQDMVDQVQKMSEEISSMQFKDLPALVQQIKDQVGVDQAMQFNTDATAALAGLLQNLQGAKQQLEQALGVVTGQAPMVPGQDGMDAGMGAEAPPPEMNPADELPDIDDMEPAARPAAASLGRGRR
jgi:hypothetical protein